MKFWLMLAASAALVGGGIFLSSCAYSIPNGGHAVITDVTDALIGPPVTGMAAAPPSSNSHAQARTNQSNQFWGGKAQ